MMALQALRSLRQQGGYDRWVARTEWPLVALALAFLVVLILPMAAPLTAMESRVLEFANLAIWATFALDYLVRLYLAPARRRFVRTHVFDLLVVALPFLRPLRLARLLVIVVATSRRAGGMVVQRITLYVLLVAAIVMATSAVVVYDAERAAPGANITSLTDSFWWALTTVTTVGYGDRYPTTQTGRLTAGFLMITGIALVGTITAAVAAWFVDITRRRVTVDPDTRDSREPETLTEQVAALGAEIRRLREDVAQLSDLPPASQPTKLTPEAQR